MKMHDDNTYASHSGRLPLSADLYEEYYAMPANDFIYRKLWFLARLFPGVRNRADHYVKVWEVLQYGAVNPSIVLDSHKGLVAVFTSLTAIGDVPTPVVKIYREKLTLLPESYQKNDVRLATVANYKRTAESWQVGCWSDFTPIVGRCLCSSNELCNSILEDIKYEAWECLSLCISQVPTPYQEGLYPVDIDHELAWNAY